MFGIFDGLLFLDFGRNADINQDSVVFHLVVNQIYEGLYYCWVIIRPADAREASNCLGLVDIEGDEVKGGLSGKG